MDIPEEAYQAARVALWGRPAGDATLVAQMAVGAAAPIIARTAQVQILREMADGLSVNAGDAHVHNRNVGDGIAFAVHRLREMADELEQGAL